MTFAPAFRILASAYGPIASAFANATADKQSVGKCFVWADSSVGRALHLFQVALPPEVPVRIVFVGR